jgi:hypothetical protein
MKKSKKTFLAILIPVVIFLSCKNPTSADPESITIFWERTYGDSGADYARTVERTSDGGYIIAGVSWHFIGFPKTHIIKTDDRGYSQWEQTFDGEKAMQSYRICETNDGGFIAVGITCSASRFQFIRMDSNGDTLWTKLHPRTSLIIPHSLLAEADGDIVVACDIDGRLGLMKFNEDAENLWTSTFADISYGGCASATNTLDRCYIIAGVEYGSPRKGVLIKADDNGDQVWTHHYSMPGAPLSFADVLPTLDGGYIVTGKVFLTETLDEAYLRKVDSSGDSVWARTYGGYDDDEFNSVHETASGNYIAVGKTHSFGSGYSDNYFELVDANGHSVISFIYGGAGAEESHDIEETIDRKYVVIGRTTSSSAGHDDIFLWKIYAP